MTSNRTLFILSLLILLLLAACQAAPAQVESTPTAINQEQTSANAPAEPAAAEPTAYPVFEAPLVDPNADYPAGDPSAIVADPNAYPGPGGMPALENRSRVTARLTAQAPDEKDPAFTRLTVELLTSQAADGLPSRTDELVGQTLDLHATAAELPTLNPGDSFEAVVSFVGDEFGGKYFATQVKVLE